MKLSIFNIEVPKENNYLIINTRSGNQYISNISINLLEQQLNNTTLDPLIISNLINLGIITDEENEFESVLKDVDEFRNSDSYLHLVIYVTNACNSSCVYCPQEKNPLFFNDEDIERIIKYVSNEINGIKHLNVEWFGGEPLLCFDTIKKLSRAFLAMCITHNVSYSAGMITNATLLSAEVFHKLTQYQVVNYQITIDGLEKIHNIQRPLNNGKNSFKAIIENLCQIRDETKKSNVKIAIRINVSKLIYPNLNEFFEFLYDTFGSDDRFYILIRLTYDWGGSSITNFEENLLPINTLESAYKLAKQKGLRLLDESMMYGTAKMICGASVKNYFGIDAGCKIYKCILFRNKQSLIGEIDEHGNMIIFDKDKVLMWNNVNNRTERCYTCKSAPQCMGYQCPINNICGEKFRCQDYFYNTNNKYLTLS